MCHLVPDVHYSIKSGPTDDNNKRICTLTTKMPDPFSAETRGTPFNNLATGAFMPDDLDVFYPENLGMEEMKSLVRKEMHSHEVGF